MPFTHLHLHTEYSLLDGANRIKDLPERIKALGMDSCAITDHGVMYGVVDFYCACKKAGVKPIIGCEVYVAQGSRSDREGPGARRNSHLILLAENETGLRNLNHLVSQAFIDGFYYKPRVDFELLERWHEGLIALSACLNGAVCQALRFGSFDDAIAVARRYRELFGEGNYFLEVQANGMLEQRRINEQLRNVSAETGIPLVATNDCHYMHQADARAHEILLCIQTGKRLSDPDHMRMGTDQLYIKSPEEMKRDLPDFHDAIEMTEQIAARCNVELDFDHIHLPDYEAPNAEDSEAYLRRLSREGLEKRLEHYEGDLTAELREVYEKRLAHELDVITRMGYTDYYLIVWDFIHYARSRKIMVGPGRGSGAASLVAYALTITNIDPIRYQLLFERFLNPERVSMPDFDTDFCYERRGEVIEYVTQKYGQSRVAQVITFGTLAARACVRDVARVLDLPYAETDRLAKLIPAELGMTLTKALNQSQELKDLYDSDAQAREVLDTALLFEGMPRHASTHAAGVVISGKALTDLVPLSRNDESIVIQYAKGNIEKLGLLKFDFLGLRTLTVLRDTRDMVRANKGIEIDFDTLPMQDKAVYEMISAGDTRGVFQLESAGMTAFMKELKPESLEDIIAGVSLFRPGPMVEIPRYVASRHDPSKIHYDHPLLEPILDVTYGCIVYQEQVMQIVRDLAGFSMGQSDNIRRAMSKKNPELLAEYRGLFVFGGTDDKGRQIDGAIRRGVPEPVAQKIFDELLGFAGYAFNKAHAAAYAVVAYQTAWLKLHHPTEFMAAMLNSFLGNLSQAAAYAATARAMGIQVLPPDVCKSAVKFTTEGPNAIRFALGAVKNAGEAILRALVEEREKNGQFTSFGDFLRRMAAIRMNKKVVESLIRASACDCFGVPRNAMLAIHDLFMDQVSQGRKTVMDGQLSLFDVAGEEEAPNEPDYPELPLLTKLQLLTMEREMLGLYVSGDPLEDYRKPVGEARAAGLSVFESSSLSYEPGAGDPDEEENRSLYQASLNNRQVVMLGMLNQFEERSSRKGNRFALLQLEDFAGRYEALMFETALRENRELLRESEVYLLAGQLMARDDDAAKLSVRQLFICDNLGIADAVEYLQQSARPYHGRQAHINRRPQSVEISADRANAAGTVSPAAYPDNATGRELNPPLRRDPVADSDILLQIQYNGEISDAGYRMLCATLAYFHGRTPVKLLLRGAEEARYLPRDCWVQLDRDLLNILAARYGADALRFLPIKACPRSPESLY